MSVMTRVVAATAVLLAAAIPVGALTVSTSPGDDIALDLPNGPAGRPASPSTGAVSVSQLVQQNAVIESDALVPDARPPGAADNTPPSSTGLVSQDPAMDALDEPEPDTATAAAAAEPAEPVAAPKKSATKSKPRRPARQAKKKGSAPGSWQLLFQGK